MKMFDALLHLETLLRSRKGEAAMTIQEANILMASKAEALRSFSVGFAGGSIVTLLATERLSPLIRMFVVFGAGSTSGAWSLGRSIESGVERILSLEGSRMQRELATIMLKKYNNDPSMHRYLSKHFYSEEVYEDSSVDKPKFRWRIRNTYVDPVTYYQSAPHDEEITYPKKHDVKMTTVESKQVNGNAAGDAAENPFDFVFGLPESAENVSRSDTYSASSRRQSRSEKRSRRRHRRVHQEDHDI